MATKTIMVPEEVVTELQRADVEQTSRREILVSCIDRGIDMETPTFKRYQAEYNEWYKKFTELKSRIEAEFVTPANTQEAIARSWNLNYNSRELVIQY